MRIGVLSLFVLLASQSKAQVNLVLNHSFEVLDSCPSQYGLSNIQFADSWFSPFDYGGSVDLFTSCGEDFGLSTPTNAMGYQIAKEGNNYGGFYLIAGFNGREYLEGILSEPLQAGLQYRVKFHYSFADSTWLITDGIGAVFTPDSLMNLTSPFNTFQLTPQVDQDSGYAPADTSNWLVFDKTFTAQGGEKYFTIGTFGNDSEHVISMFNTADPNYYCYIYIDDVSVTLYDTVNVITTLVPEDTMGIYPNPANALVEISSGNAFRFVTVTNPLGRTVCSGTCERLDVSQLSPGLYFLQAVFRDSSSLTQKLIIQR